MKNKKFLSIVALSMILVFLPKLSFAGSIFVSGEGKLKLKPDTATIKFTVETASEDRLKALEENSKKMDKVIKELKKKNVKDDQIETSQVSINPIYKYEMEEPYEQVLEGYQVVNSISVKTKELDKIGDLIDISVKAGSNRIDGIAYSSSKANEYYNQALELAVKSAKEKAEIIAKASGTRIKSINSINENYGNYYPVYEVSEMRIDEAIEPPVTPIIPKNLEVISTVVVEYEI